MLPTEANMGLDEGTVTAVPMDAQPIAPVETADPAPVANEGLSPTAVLLGLLAALGLAGAGLIALRRRGSSDAKAVPVIERPVVEKPLVADTPVVTTREEIVEDSNPVRDNTVDIQTWAQPLPADRKAAASGKVAPHSGAAVALPLEIPATYEGRDALLKRMVDAKPDRANPFRSRKARARRARLIMQSLGRTFENAEPRMDLSQYTGNWPALANRKASYAA